MIEFTCRTYPALTVAAGGRTFKFAGGKLRVAAGEASTIRDYAERRPHLGITETGEVDAPTASGETSESKDEEPNLNMTKAQLLDIAEARGLDREALEPLTKIAILKEIGTR